MRRLTKLLLCALLLLAIVPQSVSALSMPLTARSFHQTASEGFGDPLNAYAWCMAEFKGDIYVGTARLGNLNSIMPMISDILGFEMPELPGSPPTVLDWLDTSTMPPTVKDEAAYLEWNALSHAEVWRYHDGEWTPVFEAQDIPSYLRKADGSPYMTSEITGLRSMSVMTDKNGVQALYATSGGASFGAASPKLIRTTDGVNWQRLQTPVEMGRETRATAVHNDRLYAGASTADPGYGSLGTGTGSLWTSDDPSNSASWSKVLDFAEIDASNSSVVSVASFNGRVYVGTENLSGCQVWRSTTGDPRGNADWVKVIDSGGGDTYNLWAGTMKAFKNKLYVGTIAVPGLPGRTGIKGFDLFAICPDDSVRLVVGNVRPAMPVTQGALRTPPLSGWPSGFGNPLNMYCWSMEEYDGRLYLGTLDQTGMFSQMLNMPNIPSWVKSLPLGKYTWGSDLWSTGNGTFWSPVFLNGLGDATNYGIRTMKTTSDNRLFLGTANPFAGCQVWAAP